MIRSAAWPLLLSACGFVEEVSRTDFQIPELRFYVDEGTILVREPGPLDQTVDLETHDALYGASRLTDVRIEDLQVAVYANALGVGIEQLRFIAAPVSLESAAVFATVEDIGADEPDWPEVEANEQGEAHLVEFISNVRDEFLVQASITFDIPPEDSLESAGVLDLRLRIGVSASTSQ